MHQKHSSNKNMQTVHYTNVTKLKSPYSARWSNDRSIGCHRQPSFLEQLLLLLLFVHEFCSELPRWTLQLSFRNELNNFWLACSRKHVSLAGCYCCSHTVANILANVKKKIAGKANGLTNANRHQSQWSQNDRQTIVGVRKYSRSFTANS